MSMYNRLLISAGGGIISQNQQADQANAATVCIGLGGTGVSCLKTIKQEVFDRIKPDPTTDGIVSYKHIKFLAVDTDPNSVIPDKKVGKTASSLDANTEFFNISTHDIHQLIAAGPALRAKPHLKWLKVSSVVGDSTGIKIQDAKAGAGGVRQIGRLLLFENSAAFVSKVQSMISEAVAGLNADADLNIHIFTGLGGGTGSGTFLDACYLVRYAVKNMSVQTPHICGYFFMPDVNISRVKEVNTQKYIKANGYAALKELDHCMSYATNGDKWYENYGSFSTECNDAPVDLAHLVTSSGVTGATQENAYDYAMHVVADYVMEFIVKPNDEWTLNSHIANIKKSSANVTKMSGGTYDYCVLGASTAYLPYKEITTYLSAKILEKFSPLKDKLPTQQEIEKIAQTIQIKYEDLNNAIRASVPEVPFYDIDKMELFNEAVTCKELVVPATLTAVIQSMQPIQGALATNEKGMLTDVVTIGDNKTKASIISRIAGELRKYAVDSAYGPYYAAAVLHTDVVKDLRNYIDGCTKQNDAALNQEISNLTLRKQEWDEALHNVKNAGFGSRKSSAQNFAEAVYAYFDCKREIFVHESLASVLKTLRTQMDDLYNSYYGPFAEFMRNLEETFANNLATLAKPLKTTATYAKPIMTIQQLQQSLDATAEGFEYAGLVTNFVTEMLDKNADAWREKNEEKIAVAVSNFFLGVLDKAANMSMMDYLQIRFATTDPARVAQATYNDIILPLSQSAEPLFWANGAKFSVGTSVKTGFCTVPQVAAPIVAAANQITAADPTMKVIKSYNTERISVLRFYCGIPMFAYGGIEQYKLEKQDPGTYLHEAAPDDISADNPKEFRDNRQWPELVPYSLESKPTDALKKNAENYDKAYELGVVKRNYLDPSHTSWDYRVYNIKKAELDASLAAIESACKLDDLTKVKEALDRYQAYKPALEDECLTSFACEGTNGSEDTFNKDMMLSSTKCINAINEAIEGFEKYEAALKKLEDKYNDALAGSQDLNNFIDALATGLIKKNNPYTYVYVDNSVGFPVENDLTSIKDAPYGKNIPFYNAFLKYKELSDDIKKSIQDESENKRVNEYEAVAESETALKEELSKTFFGAMLTKAKQLYPADFKTITEFAQNAAAAVNLL